MIIIVFLLASGILFTNCREQGTQNIEINTQIDTGNYFSVSGNFDRGNITLEGSISSKSGSSGILIVNPDNDTIYKFNRISYSGTSNDRFDIFNVKVDFLGKKGTYTLIYTSQQQEGTVFLSLHN